MSRRIGIIGGGFLGQTLALRLAQQGARVTLFETSDHLGGLADAWQVGPVVWDRHYHVTLFSDAHLRRMLEEIGLHNELQWSTTRTGFYTDGQLYSLSSSLDFLRFAPLRWHEKLRLAWTILYASRIRRWEPLDRVPVAAWLRRLSGESVFQRIWLPLLKSKLGDAYRETSAAFIWATINRLYAARRSGLKQERFGYVKGGYARVLERLGEALRAHGVEIRLGTPIREIVSQASGVLVSDRSGEADQFDQAVLTIAPPVAADLCPQLTADEARRFKAVQMLGTVCVSLLMRKPLAGYYVTNITDSGFPFTGVIEMTALVDQGHFNDHTLVYLPKYVASDDAIFDETDEVIHDRFWEGLRRMYAHLGPDDVVAWKISRARHVMALPKVGYAECVPQVETSLPGVYLVSSAQILNNTLNVNATIGWAEACLPRLLSSQLPNRSADGQRADSHAQNPGELVARP